MKNIFLIILTSALIYSEVFAQTVHGYTTRTRFALLFNGSVLRANYSASDFALLQLNQTPAANSGITYAGWSRGAGAAQSTVAIHHPEGNVMKIATDANPPITVAWYSGRALIGELPRSKFKGNFILTPKNPTLTASAGCTRSALKKRSGLDV